MCIGMQYAETFRMACIKCMLMLSRLAMAEMTTLVASIYRDYRTTTKGVFDAASPGNTALYEVFYEECCSGMRVSTTFPSYWVIMLTFLRNMSTNLSSSARHDT